MIEETTNPKPRFISLRVKLLLGFTLLFTVVFALAFYWFYNFTTQMAMNRLAEDLQVLLTGAAAQIDGDTYEALYTEAAPREDGYTDDPRYWEHVGFLAEIMAIDPRIVFYSYKLGTEPNEVVFVGSGGALWDPPAGAKFLESFIPEYRPDTIINGATETTLLLDIYTDPWGSWISGYTPIVNSNGESVGGLGADFSAVYVLDVQKSVRDKVVVAFGLTYVTLFVFVMLISNNLTRPIIALTRIAGMIGDGQYENVRSLDEMSGGRLTDEIGSLANVFNIMVAKVYTREQTLRKQVEQLKIEVDRSKQQQQVSEIVDTDFFRELQEKAQLMRNRTRLIKPETGEV